MLYLDKIPYLLQFLIVIFYIDVSLLFSIRLG